MKKPAFLLLMVILCGCTKMDVKPVSVHPSSGNSSTTAPPVSLLDSVSYLALGDSYTYGAGVIQNDSYPYQLAAQLRNANYHAHDPMVVAFQGWKAADLLSGIAAQNITRKFDFVTILIGVNDGAKGTNPTVYTTQIDQLITEAMAFAHGYANRVFVISIPDWSVTPFATGMDKSMIKLSIDQFNTINETESKKLGANYLDITALSELAAGDPSLTGSDNLHPTGKMYALWVNQIKANIVASFK